jgi:hypothetical protein
LAALSDGSKTPVALFADNQAMEDAAFLGDAWCFRLMHELAEEGLVEAAGDRTLPAPPPRGDYGEFASTPLELTAAGRAAPRPGR